MAGPDRKIFKFFELARGHDARTLHERIEDKVFTKERQICEEDYLICCLYLLSSWKLNLHGWLDETKSSKFVSLGAVSVPNRDVRLFPAPLALMRTALIRDFLNSFTVKARAVPYGSYDKLIYSISNQL